MSRTVKDATTKAFHYDTSDGLPAHVLAFVSAYNFPKHLKALQWRTPFQAICDAHKADPSSFNINPHHHTPEPNTYFRSTSLEDREIGRVSGELYEEIVSFDNIVDRPRKRTGVYRDRLQVNSKSG